MITKKKVVGASLAAGMAVALAVAGGTYASWSDFFLDSGQNVGAGTLTLTVANEVGNGPEAPFDNLRLAPGQGKDEYTRIASNSGTSVPHGTLAVTLTDLQDREDGCKGREADVDPDCSNTASNGEFADNATIRVTAYRIAAGAECGNNVAGGGEFSGNGVGRYSAIATTTIQDAVNQGTKQFVFGGANPMVLAPGDNICVGASVLLPATANNSVQGDNATFAIRYDLVQTSPAARDTNSGLAP